MPILKQILNLPNNKLYNLQKQVCINVYNVS